MKRKTPQNASTAGRFDRALCRVLGLAAGGILLAAGSARASIAYGTINNFDTVNDTGVPAHGFQIELDDLRSANIT